jgi:hypothetical protein
MNKFNEGLMDNPEELKALKREIEGWERNGHNRNSIVELLKGLYKWMDDHDAAVVYYKAKEMQENILSTEDYFNESNKLKENTNLQESKLKEIRSLVQVSISYSDKGAFTLRWINGTKVYNGSPTGFAKFLMQIKAKDTATTPKSFRNFTYREIVQRIMDGNDKSVWVWSNILNKIKQSPGLTIFESNLKENVDKQQENYTLQTMGD